MNGHIECLQIDELAGAFSPPAVPVVPDTNATDMLGETFTIDLATTETPIFGEHYHPTMGTPAAYSANKVTSDVVISNPVIMAHDSIMVNGGVSYGSNSIAFTGARVDSMAVNSMAAGEGTIVSSSNTSAIGESLQDISVAITFNKVQNDGDCVVSPVGSSLYECPIDMPAGKYGSYVISRKVVSGRTLYEINSEEPTIHFSRGTRDNSSIRGRWNYPVTDALFEVGVGTSSARTTALYVTPGVVHLGTTTALKSEGISVSNASVSIAVPKVAIILGSSSLSAAFSGSRTPANVEIDIESFMISAGTGKITIDSSGVSAYRVPYDTFTMTGRTATLSSTKMITATLGAVTGTYRTYGPQTTLDLSSVTGTVSISGRATTYSKSVTSLYLDPGFGMSSPISTKLNVFSRGIVGNVVVTSLPMIKPTKVDSYDISTGYCKTSTPDASGFYHTATGDYVIHENIAGNSLVINGGRIYQNGVELASSDDVFGDNVLPPQFRSTGVVLIYRPRTTNTYSFSSAPYVDIPGILAADALATSGLEGTAINPANDFVTVYASMFGGPPAIRTFISASINLESGLSRVRNTQSNMNVNRIGTTHGSEFELPSAMAGASKQSISAWTATHTSVNNSAGKALYADEILAIIVPTTVPYSGHGTYDIPDGSVQSVTGDVDSRYGYKGLNNVYCTSTKLGQNAAVCFHANGVPLLRQFILNQTGGSPTSGNIYQRGRGQRVFRGYIN